MTLQKLATAPTKICAAYTRSGQYTEVPCTAQLVQGLCPNRAEHMLPFPTGYCNSGWHEGYKINKPTCKYFTTCGCKCHQDIWVMFSLSDMDRVLMDNSTWKAHTTFWMPTEEDRIQARIISSLPDTDEPVVLKSPAPDVVPDAIHVSYAPTPTGRAARGELETWVREVTDGWLVDAPSVPCRPIWIAEQIAQRHGLGKVPSSGAVDAVLKRWQTIGFAVVDSKPTRFTRYTEAGVRFGLAFMKAKAKLDA